MKPKLTPEQRTYQALKGMLDADRKLYEQCLDTVGFGYYFNELAKIARGDYANTEEQKEQPVKIRGSVSVFQRPKRAKDIIAPE